MNKTVKDDFWVKLLSVFEKYTWGGVFRKLLNLLKFFTFSNLIRIFKIVILGFWDFFEDFKRKDHLWIKTRKRLFFVKLKHFFISIFSSYYIISYLYDIYDRRNWLAENPRKANDFNPYNMTKKEWDDIMLDAANTAGIDYFGESFRITHLFDMWLQIALFIVFLNVFFFTSFFFRSVHEVFYSKDTVAVMLIISVFFFYTNNWMFGEVCLAYFYHYTIIPYWFLYLSNYLIFNYLQWRYEDEEEYLEAWANRYGTQLAEMPDLLPLPKLSKFDGNLHTVPNIYSVDPDMEIIDLIATKKRRYQDVQPGGLYYELFNSTFWRYDVDKDLVENIRDNIKKTIVYIFHDLNVEPALETFHEFLHRYYKEAEVELVGGSSSLIKQKIIIPFWNDRERHLSGKSHAQMFGYTYWIRPGIPLLIRWCYLFVWFFFEYRIAKSYIKWAKMDKKLVNLSFWKNLRRFFGLKVEDDSGFFRFTDGYVIKHRGIPRIFFKNDPAFDINIYNRAEIQYESIPVQIRNLFYDIFKNIGYFVLNFFGSFKFWVSVLLFWREGSPVRTFSRWIFIDNIWYYILIFIRFIVRVPYRIYKIFDIIIYIVYSILYLYYSINILYWSFLLNYLFSVKMMFRILFRLTRPVGSFMFYNSSPWRRYKVNQFWRGFYLFFGKFVKKFSKLNQRESFLVWSKERKK